MSDHKHLYSKMVLIRKFEERLLELFSQGVLFGTTHACIGQEATAVAVTECMTEQDILISNHRCHGHYIARTDDTRGIMAELMGKKSGVCSGRGGSQHLCRENFFTNGVQGNMSASAAGIALAEKMKDSGAITVLFVGDGTFGEGTLYESLNMASLWKLPLLVIVENNHIAQSTPIDKGVSGSFVGRAQGFGMACDEVDTNDVDELLDTFKKAFEYVRSGAGPFMQVANTYRLCGHSKGDDFRDPAEVDKHRANDPLTILSSRMDEAVVAELTGVAEERVKDAEAFARADAFADIQD